MEIAVVEWVDSTARTTGWARENVLDMQPQKLYSVGFVLDEDDDRIVLTASTDGDNLAHDYFIIPKGCITKIAKKESK